MLIPIRVLLVAAANSTTGGGEKHVADLLRGLVADGYTVGVVAPVGGDLEALAQSLNVEYFPAALGTGVSPGKIKTVRAAIMKFSPDIVHAHGTRAALFARFADTCARRRVIYTIHGIHSDMGLGRFIKLPLERHLRKKTAHFITVCKSDAAKGTRLEILDNDRTTVVYNGVSFIPSDELSTISKSSTFRNEIGVIAETPLVFHVGRASGQKDQKTLFQSFALALADVPNAILAVIITGEENDIKKLRELVDELNIAESVCWMKPRPDLLPLYTESDAFALSSLWEGFPYVIIEAMNAGCAIVSTDVDGIPEAIDSGVSGILVKPGSAEELGRALAQMLLSSPEQRNTYEDAARNKVRSEFTYEKMVAEIEQIYKKTVAGNT